MIAFLTIIKGMKTTHSFQQLLAKAAIALVTFWSNLPNIGCSILLSVDLSVDGTLSPPTYAGLVGGERLHSSLSLHKSLPSADSGSVLPPSSPVSQSIPWRMPRPLEPCSAQLHDGVFEQGLHVCFCFRRAHVPRAALLLSRGYHQEPELSCVQRWPGGAPSPGLSSLSVSITDICVYGFCSPHKSWMVHESWILICFLFLPSLKGFAGMYQIYSLHYNLINQDQKVTHV